MSQEIWSYSENEAVAAEAATAAKELAKAASCSAVGIDIGVERAGTHSEGGKLLISGPVDGYLAPDVAAEAISRAARELPPRAIHVGGTRNGREVAARVAAKLMVGCL